MYHITLNKNIDYLKITNLYSIAIANRQDLFKSRFLSKFSILFTTLTTYNYHVTNGLIKLIAPFFWGVCNMIQIYKIMKVKSKTHYLFGF